MLNAIRTAKGSEDDPTTLVTEAMIRAPSRRTDSEYHNVVHKPIDLTRIGQKLTAEEYNSLDEMVEDLELLFNNILLFYKVSADR